ERMEDRQGFGEVGVGQRVRVDAEVVGEDAGDAGRGVDVGRVPAAGEAHGRVGVGVPAFRAVDARVGVCDGPVAGPAHGVDGGGDEFAPVLLADVEQGGGGCRLGGLGGG